MSLENFNIGVIGLYGNRHTSLNQREVKFVTEMIALFDNEALEDYVTHCKNVDFLKRRDIVSIVQRGFHLNIYIYIYIHYK